MLLEQTAKYSLVTSFIWYGCLILSIIIFVIYLKFFNAKNKGYKKTQVKLGREITRLEEVVQNVKKDKRVDSLRKTQLVLANFISTLDGIATTTSLSDVNDAINMSNQVLKKIKKVDTDDVEKYTKQVNEIIDDLSQLNSMFIIIIGIIKK